MPRFGGGVLYGNDTLSACKACDVRISEVVDFLNVDRVHMQQGIFPDVQQSYLLHSALNFDEVSCKVLVGAPLKQNEFLKIDQTCLAEVLAEEAGNEHLKVDGLVSPVGERKKEGEEGEEGEGGGGEGPQVTLGGAIVLGELPVPTAEQEMEVSVHTCN